VPLGFAPRTGLGFTDLFIYSVIHWACVQLGFAPRTGLKILKRHDTVTCHINIGKHINIGNYTRALTFANPCLCLLAEEAHYKRRTALAVGFTKVGALARLPIYSHYAMPFQNLRRPAFAVGGQEEGGAFV
jgi:hypothetical protein